SAQQVVTALDALEREATLPVAPPAAAVSEDPFADRTEPALLQQHQAVATPAPKRGFLQRRTLLVAGAVVLAAVLAGVVLLLPTKNGVLRIEINDPTIEATVGANGMTIKGAGKEDLQLEPGEKTVKIKRGDLEFETDQFLLKKGQTVTL